MVEAAAKAPTARAHAGGIARCRALPRRSGEVVPVAQKRSLVARHADLLTRLGSCGWLGMKPKHRVHLSAIQRAGLHRRIAAGRGSARELAHAWIMLKTPQAGGTMSLPIVPGVGPIEIEGEGEIGSTEAELEVEAEEEDAD
jgi:hypothetical protein